MFFPVAFPLALAVVSSVSGLVVPRATAPATWATAYLEPYDIYHTRYLAIGCNTKHALPFFDLCCHPLLANQKLETSRDKQCIPSASASSSASAVQATSTATPDGGDDDEYDDCDDEDYDDEDNESSSVVVVTPTKAPVVTPTKAPTVTSTKAPAPTTKAPAPTTVKTTTQAKPTPKPAQDTNSTPASGGVNTGGFATFFYQNGVAGACGTVHGDNDMIAAIDGDRYGNLGAKSSLCGKKVKITNPANKKTVTVTIADACPTCNNGNSIDLSEGAFKQIATLDQGLVGITWSFV